MQEGNRLHHGGAYSRRATLNGVKLTDISALAAEYVAERAIDGLANEHKHGNTVNLHSRHRFCRPHSFIC